MPPPSPATPLSPAVRAWLAAVLPTGTDVRRVRRLPGATSTTVLALDAEREGERRPLVLRLVDNARWLETEPDLAPHEAAALVAVARCGVPTPALVAVDETGASCGVPAVLMTRLPGRVELTPDASGGRLERLADALATVHAVAPGDFPWRYRSWIEPTDLRPPGWTERPALWERAIERWLAGRPEEPERFVHRDYHPVNVLWQGGRLSGLVDWVNACRGPVGVDLSHCRGNLFLMYGLPAADRFLGAYLAETGADYHPFWDLEAALGMLPGPELYPPWAEFGLRGLTVERCRATTEAVVERALAQL